MKRTSLMSAVLLAASVTQAPSDSAFTAIESHDSAEITFGHMNQQGPGKSAFDRGIGGGS